MRGIAEDLGIERSTLRVWLDQFGTGRKTAADGTATRSPLPPRSSRRPAGTGSGEPETAEQRPARLETENAALRAEQAELVTEREILRAAAKYFAGETNW